jgi:hypothetical protein
MVDASNSGAVVIVKLFHWPAAVGRAASPARTYE